MIKNSQNMIDFINLNRNYQVIERLSKDGETTIASIQQANAEKEKTKTFDYDVDESAEVLEEKPEEED